MKELNKNLLIEIFRLPSMSGKEILVQEFIKGFLDKRSIKYEEDETGNIFHFSGEKPLLMAHMDTVQGQEDVLLWDFIKIRGNILSGYGVIGGDDKNGIYIILHLLDEGYDFNFAFTVEEETGGKGSAFLAKNKEKEIEKSLYALILDRRGKSDIICEQNDYGTKIFQDKLCEVGETFGYSPARGTFSDADQVNEIISAANLSVGYYNAHSKTEFVNIKHLINALNFVRTIIKNVQIKYSPPYIPPYSKTNRKKKGYNYPNYWDYWDDYWDEDYWPQEEFPEIEDVKCILCGESKEKDLQYFVGFDKHICSNCIINFLEETKDIASFFIEENEIDRIVDNFK